MARVYTGDEVGLLKCITFRKNKDPEIKLYGNIDKKAAIQQLKPIPNSSLLMAGRKNGIVSLFDKNSNQFTKEIHIGNESNGNLCGLDWHSENIYTAFSHEIKAYSMSEMQPVFTLKESKDLKKMKIVGNVLGYCGINLDFSVVDLETQKEIFKAEQMHISELDNEFPPHNHDFCFLNDNEVWICNRKEIQFIDRRLSPRPIDSIPISEYPLLHINCNEDYILTSDTIGNLYQLDLKQKRQLGTMKDFSGSIGDIQINGDLCYTVCLDRFMRRHEMKGRKLRDKLYLKQRMNCLSVDGDYVEEMSEAEEDEDIWEDLEVEEEEEDEVVEEEELVSHKTKRIKK